MDDGRLGPHFTFSLKSPRFLHKEVDMQDPTGPLRKLPEGLMDLNFYQRAAVRTAKPLDEYDDKVTRGILGLVGEAGELAEYWKKLKYQDHPLEPDKIPEELGDALWYISVMANDLGITLQQIAQMNIDKLRERFPDGFDSEQSIHRGL